MSASPYHISSLLDKVGTQCNNNNNRMMCLTLTALASMESMAVFDEISGVHTNKSKCAVCKTVSSALKCACLLDK